MNGILIGITDRGVTTSSSPGTASVRENQTARVSHFLAFLRDSYGTFGESMRQLPEIQRILEWAVVTLSGGFEHHRLPSDRVFQVLADNPDPTLETVWQSLVPVPAGSPPAPSGSAHAHRPCSATPDHPG